MIKLVVSDMDGTLTHDIRNEEFVFSTTLPKENLEAIKELHRENIDFIVATGRLKADVDQLLKPENIEYKLFSQNGSYIIDETGELLYSHTHDAEVSQFIYNFLKDNKIQFTSSVLDANHAIKDYLLVDWTELYGGNAKFVEANSIDELPANPANICVVGDSYEHMHELYKQIVAEPFFENVHVAVTSPKTIDINSKKASKGYAIEEYIKRNNIKKEEVLVVGDSYNDLTMFHKFPNSCGMTHGPREVIEQTKYQIDMFYDIVKIIKNINN